MTVLFVARSATTPPIGDSSSVGIAFASDIVNRIRVEPVRVWCEERLRGRLRGGRVPEEAA